MIDRLEIASRVLAAMLTVPELTKDIPEGCISLDLVRISLDYADSLLVAAEDE